MYILNNVCVTFDYSRFKTTSAPFTSRARRIWKVQTFICPTPFELAKILDIGFYISQWRFIIFAYSKIHLNFWKILNVKYLHSQRISILQNVKNHMWKLHNRTNFWFEAKILKCSIFWKSRRYFVEILTFYKLEIHKIQSNGFA